MKFLNSNIKNERSEAMQKAHLLTKEINPATGRKFTFSEAQKKAWFGIRLKRKMKNEVLLITFIGTDGKERKRKATLIKDFLPMRKKAVTPTNYRKFTSTKFTYFDLEKNGFRSFLPQNVICYEVVKIAKAATIETKLQAA